ncbi:pimeloyl-ACP methyl ester carboxylesterase [Trinickia symbiotica]|uniref:Alpha/beta hydrolase n=1 Tax=Trinickia symbiotica TaxID=863227 RepID=A0A2N7X4X8_9BURK|nr:alpha/beta fold hydrolase [Trinickia symbiotica]PMS36515.1 alpha/beta hydrolase [Trinickia symbiotica]PPK44352.1 pimeloyl-ACP methyl ester carboxylesterase [Trinickia symbiotica]
MTFADFTPFRVATGGSAIFGLKGGSGAPLLLLHGHARTHEIWHRCAQPLARHFTVIATDLRGYGSSVDPEREGAASRVSKRALAQDQVDVMRRLGFEHFLVCAHEWGASVAHRMALDHPDAVDRLMLLGTAPSMTDYDGAAELAAADSIDLEHDRADVERGRRVACPLRVLWGARSAIGQCADPIGAWQRMARDASGHALDCGSLIPEEAAGALVAEMLDFFEARESDEFDESRTRH